MAAPTPRTWTVGESLTAAKLNADLRDGLNFLLAPPRAELYRGATNQTIPTGANTAIQFDAEVIDTDGGHSTSTNNSRYTAQTAGWYDCVCQAWWDTASSTGIRSCAAHVNGGGFARRTVIASGIASNAPIHQCVATLFLNVGDYVEFIVLQTSGSNRLLGWGVDFTNATFFWRSK